MDRVVEDKTLKCGACQFTTKEISILHIHLDTHNSCGSYVFCHDSRTAYPRFELVSFGTQTEPFDFAVLESIKRGDIYLSSLKIKFDSNYASQRKMENQTDLCTKSENTSGTRQDKSECTNKVADIVFKPNKRMNVTLQRSFKTTLPDSENVNKKNSNEAGAIENPMIVNDANLIHPSQDSTDRIDSELNVNAIESELLKGAPRIANELSLAIKNQVNKLAQDKSSSICAPKVKNTLSNGQIGFSSSICLDENNPSHIRSSAPKAISTAKPLNEQYLTHNTSGEKHACRFCGTSFATKSETRAHVQYCVKSVSCDICQKRFSEQSKLNVHMRTHSGLRPYICDFCGKTFTYTTTLNKHRKFIHEKVRNFKCSICDWKFVTRQMLERHEKRHTKERDFMCSYCGKVFGTKCTLSVHTRTHTGEVPYSCDFCGMKFKHNSQRKKHQANCDAQVTD